MNAPSLSDQIDSTGAARVAAVRWGGLADTVRQDCLDPGNLDVKTQDLLQRLDELAACSGLNEVAQFLDSPRGFSVLERNYLMSPLLDQIYVCLTLSLSAKAFVEPVYSPDAPVMPFESKILDDAADRIPVRPLRTGLAVVVSCMKGFGEALEFILDRERHLVTSMSCDQLLDLLEVDKQQLWNIQQFWDMGVTEGVLAVQPLALASYWGHVSCVECLLRHGADVHGDQDCALRCSAAEGHDLVVDLLLWAGADVHVNQDVALHAAIQKGHIATVKRLLQAGADVTSCDQEAIREAAGKPSVEVLRCLLDALGDVPLNGRTLALVTDSGSADNLQLLLDRGADPNFKNCRPLVQVVAHSGKLSPPVFLSMVDMLIKAGADVHAGNESALRMAIGTGTVVSVQRMLSLGASLQAVLNDPRSTFTGLGFRGDLPVVNVLLDSGMPLDGRAAADTLAEAGLYNHTQVIELFERRGVPFFLTDSARLVAAAGKDDVEVMQTLLKRQPNPFALHVRALQVGVDCCNYAVVAALLEHGYLAGSVPPAGLDFERHSLILQAASDNTMSIFRLLIRHIAFDSRQLIQLLHRLLAAEVFCKDALALLLDRYAGTLLSEADLEQLLQRAQRMQR